jgi:hypothetical protein
MGRRFNGFLIGYFVGLHMVYYMPQQQYKNFQQKLVYPLEKEYHKSKSGVDYLELIKIAFSGSGEFLFGKESTIADLLDYQNIKK